MTAPPIGPICKPQSPKRDIVALKIMLALSTVTPPAVPPRQSRPISKLFEFTLIAFGTLITLGWIAFLIWSPILLASYLH
jgi:hypothetical protein